jgi:polyferredoxin
MSTFDDSLLEDEISEEALKQKKILMHEKDLEFERKNLEEKRKKILKSHKKVYFNWKMWLIAVLIIAFLIFLMAFLN